MTPRRSRFFTVSKRYEHTVQLLKDHELWTPAAGEFFHHLIIHTQPPVSLTYMKKLLDCLIDCGIDSYWCPRESAKRWGAALDLILAKEETTDSEAGLSDIGITHPVSYGIQQIRNLQWPKTEKAKCINRFVDIVVHSTTASGNNGKAIELRPYYRDVYQLRDVLIDRHASSALPVALPVKGQHRKNLKKKKEEVSRFLDRSDYSTLRRGLGDSSPSGGQRAWLIDDPPFIPFQAAAVSSKTSKKKAPKQHSQAATVFSNTEHFDPVESPITPDPRGLLAPPLQYAAKRMAHANFMRNNVPSLADPNQLSLHTLITYWRYLIKKNQVSLLAVNLAAFLTGIRGRRWNLLATDAKLDRNNISVSTSPPELTYFIQNGATNFEQTPISNAESDLDCAAEPKAIASTEIMTLPLPPGLASALSSASNNPESWAQASHVRGYARKNSGPRPTTDRIARSGSTLLRLDYFTDSEQGLLAGNVPIRLRARNCYVAREAQAIRLTFQEMCNNLWSMLEKRLNPKEAVHATLSDLLACTSDTPSASHGTVGSQLAETPLWSPPKNASTISRVMRACFETQAQDSVKVANLMELHLYWMLQYSMGQRPSGAATRSINCDGYRLHSDKDSAHYTESKLLKMPTVVRQQFLENQKCRSEAIRFLRRHGIAMQCSIEKQDVPWFFELSASGKLFSVRAMHGKDAVQLGQALWEKEPPFNRSNFSRHQCSTLAHTHANELAADLWLGHHIDGLDPYAPVSTLGTPALTSLIQLQNEMLKRAGLKLIVSPWQ